MDYRIVSWLSCAAIVGLVLWAALWSNGGKDTSVTGAPKGQPGNAAQVANTPGLEQMLTRTFTQNDPKQCTDDMTGAFLLQMFGSSRGTLDRCRRTNTPQSETSAVSIEVVSVTATRDSATAAIKASGGNMDGSVLTLSLVHQGGRWKLDHLTDVQIDRARLDQRVENDLGARGYLPSETSCAIGKFDRTVSDQDIERSAVLGDTSVSVEADAVSCLSRPTLLRELSQSFTAALESRGFPAPIVRCVVDRLTHGVPTARLRHLLAAGLGGADGWARLGYEAASACSGSRSAGAAGTNRI
jgi:hypothetical protein